MINTFVRNWHAFKKICAEEAEMLEAVNDCILQANTVLKEYKEMYDLRLSQLEESVAELNQALPDTTSELGLNVAVELQVRGLARLENWEADLDACTFEPYAFDELQDVESHAPDENELQRAKFDHALLLDVLDIVKRFSPSKPHDPFAPTIQEGIDPAATTAESMVTMKEADLRMLVSVLQEYLPKR